LQDVYNPQDAALYLSKKLNIKLLILPHDVGAVKEADNVFSVFDEIVRRLTNG
jgi:zinc/manganese transport system substrate-binding protein